MDASDIAAYVAGGLDAGARERIEVHLADCASCRADAIAALRARERGRVSWRWVAPALAAAALAVLVLPRAARQPIPVDRERGAAPAAAVALAGPGAGVVLPAADVPLVWRSAGPGTDYRVTVTTEDGGRVFSGSTEDTALSVPASSLRAGRRYLWAVDAILPDGTAATSGARGFTIRP